MALSKNIISLFKGAYNEYGSKETITRINRVLNQNFSNEEPTTIDFTPSTIVINSKVPTKITFYDDSFVVEKDYKTYKSYNSFDLEALPYRKSMCFRIEDGSFLVLDSIDTDTVKTMRLMKTKKDDGEFLDSYYEKEHLEMQEFPIQEVSNYKEYPNGDTDEQKQITYEENGLYYYHHSFNNKESRFLETAVTYTRPKYYILGRVRKPGELLISTEKMGCPNIQFRGNYVNDQNSLNYFNVTIKKDPRKKAIHIETVDYSPTTGKQDKNQISLITTNYYDYFTFKELSGVLKYFATNALPYGAFIMQELINIIETYRNQLSIVDFSIDAVDLNMSINPDFNHFAFEIYENLAEYNELLERQIAPMEPNDDKKVLS